MRILLTAHFSVITAIPLVYTVAALNASFYSNIARRENEQKLHFSVQNKPKRTRLRYGRVDIGVQVRTYWQSLEAIVRSKLRVTAAGSAPQYRRPGVTVYTCSSCLSLSPSPQPPTNEGTNTRTGGRRFCGSICAVVFQRATGSTIHILLWMLLLRTLPVPQRWVPSLRRALDDERFGQLGPDLGFNQLAQMCY